MAGSDSGRLSTNCMLILPLKIDISIIFKIFVIDYCTVVSNKLKYHYNFFLLCLLTIDSNARWGTFSIIVVLHLKLFCESCSSTKIILVNFNQTSTPPNFPKNLDNAEWMIIITNKEKVSFSPSGGFIFKWFLHGTCLLSLKNLDFTITWLAR